MTIPTKEGETAWPGSGPVPSPGPAEGADDRIRLILVDDDADFREATAGELTDLGFSVQSFADGASMLASVAEGTTADVIVLDWGLPRCRASICCRACAARASSCRWSS
jgi:two-component system response regulator ChvI